MYPHVHVVSVAGFVVTRANIRIWIHDRDLGRLQQMLWEGHGDKLRVETSNNPRVKRFLEAVPYIMMWKVKFGGSVPAFAWNERGKRLEETTFIIPDRDSNPNIPEFSGPLYCEGDTLDHSTTGAGPRAPQLRWDGTNDVTFLWRVASCLGLNGTIKEVHGATVRDDISTLMKKTEDPVPNTIFLSKDQNGLNPLHKAAGLGHTELVEYILEKNPKAANMTDNEGKLPLHYAAAVKDAGNIYNMLVEVGSDERTQDNSSILRTATVFPPAWDWRLLNNMVYDFGPIVTSEEGKRSGFVFGGEEVLSESDKSKTVDSALDSQSPESEPREMNHTSVGVSMLYLVTFVPDEPHMNHTSVGVSMSYVEHPDPTSKGVHVGEEEEDEGMGEEEVDKSDTGEQEKDEEPEQGAPPEDKDQVDRWERREDEETGKQDQQEVEESDNETVGEGEEGQDVSHEREDVAMGGHQHQETGEEKEDEAVAAEEETDTTEGDTKVADGEEEDAEVGGEEFAQGEAELDAEVRHFVETGNMEELAALVLNGQGERLVGHSSTDPELQSFLNNVPAYMAHYPCDQSLLMPIGQAHYPCDQSLLMLIGQQAKIRAVHEAAKEGRLRDLQASLDRRKFAISRDNSSGLGATPLHVATLFGHTSIRGHTAEYYQQHPERLTHQKLLKDYGASEEIAEDSLSDKALLPQKTAVPDDTVTARRDADDPDMLETLEICYESAREDDAESLLRRHLKRPVFDRLKPRLTRSDHSLLDVIWPAAKKRPERPAPDLDEILEQNGGVIVPDRESYIVFSDLLLPLIKDLHGLVVTYELSPQPQTMFFDQDDDNSEEEQDGGSILKMAATVIDPTSRWIISGRIECSRNLEDYQFPSCLTLGQLETIEREVINVLDPGGGKVTPDIAEKGTKVPEEEDKVGATYYKLDEIIDGGMGIRYKLEAADLLIALPGDANENYDGLLHGKHWPHGRGVYLYDDELAAVWINVQEHARVVCSVGATGDVGRAYRRLSELVGPLDEKLRCARDPLLGHLTSRPSCLGNTLRFSLSIYLPKLGQEVDKLRHLCSVRSLHVTRLKDRQDAFRVSNKQCLSVREVQTFKDFSAAVANIIQLEKSLSMANYSPNPGGRLFGRFRKK
uniref:Arginine kinase n=1 Tax=Timema monikensis TaxID=170555 RepID=A0A7R9ED80_9NEOP|nr:unnamed protein product [Timema monikensis]